MATYYSNGSNHRDVMPTLYLGEPGHTSYPESSLPSSMVYMNYSSAGSYSDHLVGNSQPQLSSIELSVPTVMLSQDSTVQTSDSSEQHQGILSNLVSSRLDRAYRTWPDGNERHDILVMRPTSTPSSMSKINGQQDVTNEHCLDLRTQLDIIPNGQGSNVSGIQGQALSLSLSTQITSSMQIPSYQYQQNANATEDALSHSERLHNADLLPPYSGRNFLGSAALVQTNSYHLQHGLSGVSSTIPNSKYLKAAQQLLDEVVNVHKALKQGSEKHGNVNGGLPGSKEIDGGSKNGDLTKIEGVSSDPQDSACNSTAELSMAERQDLQNKMTKLLEMLDEVDRRYKQYYHQMQIVVSSFDVIAGCGASKPYTALALQTISRQFRCLRDAINNQIKVTRKNLGEQDGPSGTGGGITRLRFIDQQLRQHRALHQFGMVQQHAWRPQRGLPENSVSVLRAWLFEHFLHPYPKDSDKLMLARQTGLTRSQVSNWFINARVRLWKPMVEEMYKEEIGDTELDSNSSSDNVTKTRDETKTYEDREESQCMRSEAENYPDSLHSGSKKADPMSDIEMVGTMHGFLNHVNSKGSSHGNIELRVPRSNTNDGSLLQDAFMEHDSNGRFMTYQMAELGRFENGGVSLTLGLQHCDGGLPVSGSQQSFVTVREGENMYGAVPNGADAAEYDCTDVGNQRHRFGPSHLLHDFVA